MLRRILLTGLLLATFFLIPARVGLALPPSPQLDNWNEGAKPTRQPGETDADYAARLKAWTAKMINRKTWNCYNYGVDGQTTDAAGDAERAHPGKGRKWPNLGVAITAVDMCTKARDRAKLDGLHEVVWAVGNPIPAPPANENLVALGGLAGDKGDGADYHWWRLNGDGSWSHKRGSTKAKTTYTDGTGAEKPLTDPRMAAQRDGYELCGFMSVPKAGVTVGALALAPNCDPQRDVAVCMAASGSGMTMADKVLSPAEISTLAAMLPPFSPSNRVPDPHWPAHPAGSYEGISVLTDDDGIGPVPPVLRAYLGTVEVVRAWPDTEGVAYYNDTNGLESFLGQTLFTQPLIDCPEASPPSLLTPCQCSDLATGYETTSVDGGRERRDYALAPIAPNPHRGGPVRLEFALAREANVRLSVLDVAGREIALIDQDRYSPGVFTLTWDGTSRGVRVPAGFYFVRMRAAGQTLVRSLVIAP
jgi:hypothetical protein